MLTGALLTAVNGLYELTPQADPTPAQLLATRATVALLSERTDQRGSVFGSELAAGRIRTQSDVAQVIGVSLPFLREDLTWDDQTIIRAALVDVTVTSPTEFSATVGILANDVVAQAVVEVDDG